METKPDQALESVIPLPSKRRKMDENVDDANKSNDIGNECISDLQSLQLKLGEIREKYTVAVGKLMDKKSKLEIMEMNQRCKNMSVKCDRLLIIPDFKVPTKIESQCPETNTTNLDELKNRIKRQMAVVETLNKMKSCPIAQVMLEL